MAASFVLACERGWLSLGLPPPCMLLPPAPFPRQTDAVGIDSAAVGTGWPDILGGNGVAAGIGPLSLDLLDNGGA
jgi:hypothetical protein